MLFRSLGFVLGSTLMLWALTLVYTFNLGEVKKDWRDRKLFLKEFAKSGVFSLAASLVIYYVFTHVLTSRLPVFSLF